MIGKTQGAFDGPVFVLRADTDIASAVWVRCHAKARYRFESFPAKEASVELQSPEDVRRFFPFALQSLDSRLMRGERIRVEYVVSGRFVLDDLPNSATDGSCRAATHFVSSIVVGSYTAHSAPRAALLTGSPTTELGVLSGLVDREDTQGSPTVCSQSAGMPPQAGCTVPLALRFSPVPAGFITQQLRVSDLADSTMTPSVVNMPGGIPSPSVFGGRVSQSSDPCYRGFLPTGDSVQDLSKLGKDCASAAGMVPKSKVLVGHQAPKEEPDTFLVQLESGSCYRAFAVGARGVRELNLAWRAPDGAIVAKDLRPGQWAVVGTEGPFCPELSGLYELVVAVEAGAGSFAAQVWELPR